MWMKSQFPHEHQQKQGGLVMQLGLNEGVGVMLGMLVLISALPFLMYLLERNLDEPKRKRAGVHRRP